MAATLFRNGTIWTGTSESVAEALLVVDGAVAAVGEDATARATDEEVDLDGGFLMPSFGDGHAHPLLGGLEEVGPPVRGCGSVDEIVEAVRGYAERHPEAEWIVGASYDGSLAEGGLFDARWLDAAVPDRPVVLRAWDYHTVWCNSVALQRAGITPVVITGRDSQPLRARLQALGVVNVHYGTEDKAPAAEKTLHALGVDWREAAAIGDDWPVLPVLRRCAFAAAPANAHEEVKAAAAYVTRAAGGHGAAREFCDLLLVASGRYAQLLGAYQ